MCLCARILFIACVFLVMLLVRVCVHVCVCLTAYPWVSCLNVLFPTVFVTVYCMQPCEAVCLLAASRLVFPKQAAGLWLRFVCLRVCVCMHLFDSDCVQVHGKFSTTAVCIHVSLCDLFKCMSVCLSACPSGCLFPSLPVC